LRLKGFRAAVVRMKEQFTSMHPLDLSPAMNIAMNTILDK
jgi:hypothetical protein